MQHSKGQKPTKHLIIPLWQVGYNSVRQVIASPAIENIGPFRNSIQLYKDHKLFTNDNLKIGIRLQAEFTVLNSESLKHWTSWRIYSAESPNCHFRKRTLDPPKGALLMALRKSDEDRIRCGFHSLPQPGRVTLVAGSGVSGVGTWLKVA